MEKLPHPFAQFARLSAALAVALTMACGSDSAGDSELPPPPDGERLVEEGDIVRLEGNTMFVLNRWRGLLVVDLNDATQPQVTGSIPYRSDPLELYLRNGNIFAVLRSPVDDELCPTCNGSPSHQSLLLVVNVQNAQAPRLVAKVALEGFVTDTRFVGDAFYAVSNGGSLLQSVDLSDPARPRAVSRLALNTGGNQAQVLVTDKIFYVAAVRDYSQETLGECEADRYGPCTLITAIDVSSPTGHLHVGARYALNGYLMNRWALDHHEGTLRLMVRPWRRGGLNRPAILRTFRASSAYELEALATLPLLTERPEQLTAVRFDGPRAFAVTFERIDPLFTIDLQDPAHPKLMGHLETPGWLDFIVPRGDRLIAVGRDREDDTAPWQLHASLYDVANLAQPRLLARVLFGSGTSQLADDPNQLAKVVRVVDELGLLLVPFRTGAANGLGPTPQGQLQLFQFTRDTLVRAGNAVHPGLILRALPLAGSKLVTVSHESTEVLDVAEPLQPKVLGQLQFARQVRDVVLTESHGFVLWEDPATSRDVLSVLPPGSTSLASATHSVDVGKADRLFVLGSRIFAVAMRPYSPTSVTAVTLTPQHMLVVDEGASSNGRRTFGSGQGFQAPTDQASNVMAVGESHLAFLAEGERTQLLILNQAGGVEGQIEWPGVENCAFVGTHQGHLVVRGRERRHWLAALDFDPPWTLAFVDVNTPAAPRLFAQTRVAGRALVAQDGLLISNVNARLTISNIDAAGVVTNANTMAVPVSEFTVAIEGAFAAVRTPWSLQLWDLTVRTAPRELAAISQPKGGAVRALLKGRAFLEGAVVYDMRNGTPRLQAQHPSSLPFLNIRSRPTPAGTHAYFPGGFYGIHVLAMD